MYTLRRSGITLQFEGAKGARLTQAGDLQIHLENGILILDRPAAYQMTAAGRKTIHAAYIIASDGAIKFSIGRYDHTLPLVIDPALSYATYLDKLSLNVAAVAVDGAGSTYVTGITFSSSYPITPGILQSTCMTCSSNGPTVFVTKLNPAGTAQVYSTYLGGSAYNQPFGLAVDGTGNAVVVGRTQSTDFPVKSPIGVGTAGNGTQFGFVSSLTPDGSALNYSSLLGGGSQPYQSSTTIVNAVAFDANGNAYISGTTDSPEFSDYAGRTEFWNSAVSCVNCLCFKVCAGGLARLQCADR